MRQLLLAQTRSGNLPLPQTSFPKIRFFGAAIKRLFLPFLREPTSCSRKQTKKKEAKTMEKSLVGIVSSEVSEETDVLSTMKPRIKASVVAKLSGRSQRSVRQLAANDNIPGAVKQGGLWMFDQDLFLLWHNEGSKCHEKKKNQKTSSSKRVASFGGSVSRSTASPTESRFAQLLKESRRKKLKAA
ncbi:hypothetical protein [Candidatus Halocynthiibacter alkanivorans]|uniref:hypothetical protein n=1 Tax=Candidatus Halocynthiibacter alkanivorans TaxID=2267619 RepID=UPI001F45E0B0|nr:hypothetical protein [Candidatus Halocynthiibacter alkanivorans]